MNNNLQAKLNEFVKEVCYLFNDINLVKMLFIYYENIYNNEYDINTGSLCEKYKDLEIPIKSIDINSSEKYYLDNNDLNSLLQVKNIIKNLEKLYVLSYHPLDFSELKNLNMLKEFEFVNFCENEKYQKNNILVINTLSNLRILTLIYTEIKYFQDLHIHKLLNLEELDVSVICYEDNIRTYSLFWKDLYLLKNLRKLTTNIIIESLDQIKNVT